MKYLILWSWDDDCVVYLQTDPSYVEEAYNGEEGIINITRTSTATISTVVDIISPTLHWIAVTIMACFFVEVSIHYL